MPALASVGVSPGWHQPQQEIDRFVLFIWSMVPCHVTSRQQWWSLGRCSIFQHPLVLSYCSQKRSLPRLPFRLLDAHCNKTQNHPVMLRQWQPACCSSIHRLHTAPQLTTILVLRMLLCSSHNQLVILHLIRRKTTPWYCSSDNPLVVLHCIGSDTYCNTYRIVRTMICFRSFEARQAS